MAAWLGPGGRGSVASLGMSRREPSGMSMVRGIWRSFPPAVSSRILRSRASFCRAPSDMGGPRRFSHCRAASTTHGIVAGPPAHACLKQDV
jgi:hypothetical protein